MKVTIGFHYIDTKHPRGDSVLTALNNAGLTVDGNAIELVYQDDNGADICRVWTEGTLEQFHEAADLLMAINSGGPVMFVASGLNEQQFDLIEAVALSYKIDFDDGAAADNEFFGYCEEADHIRLLSNQLA